MKYKYMYIFNGTTKIKYISPMRIIDKSPTPNCVNVFKKILKCKINISRPDSEMNASSNRGSTPVAGR
jgi:hypothetical protein